MTVGAAVQVWPFLIARGRRRGYSVLLAPDILVSQGDYGFLEEVAAPARPGEPPRIATLNRAGHEVCVVWADHTVTAADLDDDAPNQPVRDEHSRPLRLIFGFVAMDATVTAPAEEDLFDARAVAIPTYNRFLASEDSFSIEASRSFSARSEFGRRVPAATPLATVTPLSRPGASRPTVPVVVRHGRVAPLVAAGVGAVVAVAAITVYSLGGSPSPSCPTLTPTPVVSSSPSGTHYWQPSPSPKSPC